jgi:hypothetical protein
MNRVLGMVSVKNVLVILAATGVLAIAVYAAQALLTAPLNIGSEVVSSSQAETGVAVEREAASIEDTSSSPAFEGIDPTLWHEYIQQKRALEEDERAFEDTRATLWHEFIQQKRALEEDERASEGIDPTLWHEFIQQKLAREPGLQPGM